MKKRINLRIDQALYDAIEKKAKEEGRSLNGFLAKLLSILLSNQPSKK